MGDMTAVANNESKDTVNMNLTQAIVKEYETTKAFDVIAKKYHTSEVKVQRILITEGLWTSPRVKQVAALRAQGLTPAEIAERMGKDLRTVQTFLPYSRGQYGQEETDDSVKSKKYRERMNAAAERMTLKEEAVAKNDLAVYGAPMPLVLEATFMPFRDVIISDGLVMPFNILVGGGMKRMFKDLYMTAKKSGRIHQSL